MARARANVTQAAIQRAVRAAERIDPKRVVDVLPDGTIRIFPASEPLPTSKPAAQSTPAEAFDEWVKANGGY